jgi:cathepsin D
VSVDAVTSGFFLEAPVSGLMGLGFEALSNTGVPFWQALIDANLLDSPEMSFWLARDLHPESETSLAYGGVFTLGGRNTTLFSGDIEFHDLVSTPSQWLISLSSKYYSV